MFYEFAKSVEYHNSKKKITDQNKGKLADGRKCFLVKQWATKSEIKMVRGQVIWHGTI